MSFHPLDLVGDADLQAYERQILTQFGGPVFDDKRRKALEDWLFPILTSAGFDPYRLVTRAAVAQALGYTGSAYADVTAATQDGTEDDVDLAAVFATPATDALLIGSARPFVGLAVQMAEAVSAVASELGVAYWNGAWSGLPIADRTSRGGAAFGGGGSVTWATPIDWQRRSLSGSPSRYWAKVTVSATPASAKAARISVIRASCLRAPATFRTLQLIFAEAPTVADGPWVEKAEFYKGEAEIALQRALQICGDEFDSDDSGQIDGDEATQTVEQVTGGGWSLERG
ncbi:MAG: hypothetical protein AB7Q29_19595 [Vicinamibacterales bacterium]